MDGKETRYGARSASVLHENVTTEAPEAEKSAPKKGRSPVEDFFRELLFGRRETVERNVHAPDITFLILVIILLCYGSVVIFSAGHVYAQNVLGDSMYFVKNQLEWAFIGIAAMILLVFIDYKIIRRFSVFIYATSVLLLALVPIIGKTVNGAKRWIILGPIRIQPTEIAKFAIVVMLAAYISIFREKMSTFKYGIVFPGCLIGIVCAMTALEKHLSGTIILFLIGLSVVIIAGARLKYIGILGGTFAVGATGILLISDYAKARIDAWINPENYIKSTGWQPMQSLMAIGSGGLFGVGLGNSYQKHLWLPEPQNDFIFAILCEELGLIGALALIVLFILLIWRGFSIGMRAPDAFSSVLVMGLTAKLGIQVLLNIAVVTVSIPTTGVALPFFSYGGSALVMQLAEMGIILSISRFSSAKKI